MKKILSYKDYNQEVNEGWKENLFAEEWKGEYIIR